MLAAVRLPLDLLHALAESVQALAALPETLERSIRDTNALMARLGEQLGDLHAQVDRLGARLDAIAPSIERVAAQTGPLADVADGARRELVAATAQLAATGASLERALQMAAPLDVVGKRIADRFRRVTGGRGGDAES